MTYTVTRQYAHGEPTLLWLIAGEEPPFAAFAAYSQADALWLAAMLNKLTSDQCAAASLEAVAQWKETTVDAA